MQIGTTNIEDSFAEAFDMKYVRLIVTAVDDYWLSSALQEFTGYGASVIGCDAEIAVEHLLPISKTPDHRPGASVLVFGFSVEALSQSLTNRVGQCLMTCPTCAVFDGWGPGHFPAKDSKERRISLGKHLRFFGDGYQKSKLADQDRYWRIPVMDGEFLVADTLGWGDGIGGGNLIIQGKDQDSTLSAARRAADVIAELPNVISPFPGGVVRSGSKVGSKYKALSASTADAYCPTLRGRVKSKLSEGVNCAYEIVIDGTDHQSISVAIKAAMQAAAGEDIITITAGNYGGNLGKHHFYLKDLVESD